MPLCELRHRRQRARTKIGMSIILPSCANTFRNVKYAHAPTICELHLLAAFTTLLRARRTEVGRALDCYDARLDPTVFNARLDPMLFQGNAHTSCRPKHKCQMWKPRMLRRHGMIAVYVDQREE